MITEKITMENKIYNVLKDDSLKNALEFLTFLKENEFQLDPNGDNGEGWAVGGVVGNSFGFILINGVEEMPGPWTIWLNSSDYNESTSMDNELKENTWTHVNKCSKCHKGWEDCGIGNKIIFGREFENLCHSPLMFTNPDTKTLETVKKLLINLKSRNNGT